MGAAGIVVWLSGAAFSVPCVKRPGVVTPAFRFVPTASRLRPTQARDEAVEDGRLEIDNNICENAIRPTAIGKRNFLFIGHPEAGQRSAVIYSVLGSCRRHGINPAEYLQDVFERLPKAKTSEVKSLTPAAWAKAKCAAVRQSN